MSDGVIVADDDGRCILSIRPRRSCCSVQRGG